MGNGLREVVLEYLSHHNTMTLATASDNSPWAASLFYASTGFTLYFISNPNVCRHCQNIAVNSRVAVTISENYSLKSVDDWRKVRGIQMEGIAEMLIAEEEISGAAEAYVRKYPFVSVYLRSILSFPGVLSFLERTAKRLKLVPDFTASADNKLYKVTPTNVWFVDNEASFERRQEVRL